MLQVRSEGFPGTNATAVSVKVFPSADNTSLPWLRLEKPPRASKSKVFFPHEEEISTIPCRSPCPKTNVFPELPIKSTADFVTGASPHCRPCSAPVRWQVLCRFPHRSISRKNGDPAGWLKRPTGQDRAEES